MDGDATDTLDAAFNCVHAPHAHSNAGIEVATACTLDSRYLYVLSAISPRGACEVRGACVLVAYWLEAVSASQRPTLAARVKTAGAHGSKALQLPAALDQHQPSLCTARLDALWSV